MNEISLEVIDGVVRFCPGSINCRQEANQNTSSSAQVKSLLWNVKQETIFQIYKNFDQVFKVDPFFWKKRTIFSMMLSPSITSLSFYPTQESVCQMLFIQKLNVCSDRKGFLAPYLSKEEREQWKAKKTGAEVHYVYDQESIIDSIQMNEEFVRKQLKEVLDFFLKDESTKILGITYKDNSGLLSTVCWYKK